MSVFPRFCFVLSLFRVFLSDGSSCFAKKIASKIFYKTFDQKSQTDFFSSRFWAIKKYQKNKSDLGPFLASDPPTHPPRGSPIFFFGGPLDN
jgi:hypothetical protein